MYGCTLRVSRCEYPFSSVIVQGSVVTGHNQRGDDETRKRESYCSTSSHRQGSSTRASMAHERVGNGNMRKLVVDGYSYNCSFSSVQVSMRWRQR